MKKAIIIRFRNGGHFSHILCEGEYWNHDRTTVCVSYKDFDGNDVLTFFPYDTVKDVSSIEGDFDLEDMMFRLGAKDE